MVDAADSKSASGDRVGVQVPSAVPPNIASIDSDAAPTSGTHERTRSKIGDVI